MLYGEIIAVCSEMHAEHINTLCGQKAELLNVKHDIYIDCRRETVTSSVLQPFAARRVLPSVRVSTASILRSHHLALRCDPITATASALPGFRRVAGLEAVLICSERAGWM